MEKENKKKKIGIVFGGCSPEYLVSLESAYSVITHMNLEKYEPVLIGITKEGDWYLYEGEVEKIKEDHWKEDKSCVKAIVSTSRSDHGIFTVSEKKVNFIILDAIFPILHGKNGEDGTVQGLIELSGIPLIGCDVLSSSLCMDKFLSHVVVSHYGINVAKNAVIDQKMTNEEIKEQVSTLSYPLFVKPMRAGSSFGITKVEKEDELEKAIQEAFKYDTEVIIEEEIKGVELGCAVLGKDTLTVGELDEVELTQGFFNYTEKYTLETSKIHVPARISKEVSDRAKEMAKKIYQVLKCKGLARVDLFLTPNGELYFNEVNTIPGFTAHSRYPTMMKEVGIRFEELIDQLITLET